MLLTTGVMPSEERAHLPTFGFLVVVDFVYVVVIVADALMQIVMPRRRMLMTM